MCQACFSVLGDNNRQGRTDFCLCLFVCFWVRWVFVAARWLFSSCGERGLLFVAVPGLLTAVASLVVEHGP